MGEGEEKNSKHISKKELKKEYPTNVSGVTLEMGEGEVFPTVAQAHQEREAPSQGRIGRWWWYNDDDDDDEPHLKRRALSQGRVDMWDNSRYAPYTFSLSHFHIFHGAQKNSSIAE